jgi:hypothetical protein
MRRPEGRDRVPWDSGISLQADVRDVKSRLSSIENYIATMHGDQERTGIKVDDVIARIERLEKCVGLVDVDFH